MQLTEVGAGYCHFPNEVEFDEEYFAQLTAEKLVTRYQRGRPRQEWVQTRPRNEAIDIRVYGLACRRLIGTREPEPEPEKTPTPKRVNKSIRWWCVAVDLIIRRVVEGSALSVPDREKLIDQIVDALRFELGGLRVYINSKPRINSEQLRLEFTGSNVDELAEKYRVNRATVYRNLNE